MRFGVIDYLVAEVRSQDELSPAQPSAVMYSEQDWIDKYSKIVGGKMIVTRSGDEEHLLSLIREYGHDEALKRFTAERSYKENAPLLDLMIKSHLERPASDPVPPPPGPEPRPYSRPPTPRIPGTHEGD
jgi:hypothetical protein